MNQEALFIHLLSPNETSSVNPAGQDALVLLTYMVQVSQKNWDVKNIEV